MIPIKKLISRRKKALKRSTPKTRERLRHELRVAKVVELLKKEMGA